MQSAYCPCPAYAECLPIISCYCSRRLLCTGGGMCSANALCVYVCVNVVCMSVGASCTLQKSQRFEVTLVIITVGMLDTRMI
jgi:hypothetical protein